MKKMVVWSTRNQPAMNTLMVSIIIVGILAMLSLRREVFPQFELDVLLVSVPYPGATPEEVEEGICQKLEEAVRPIDGIKKQTAIAKEGSGSLVLELQRGANVQKVLNEVRSAIDLIPSFPELAEEPEVKQITFRIPAINVGIIGQETDDPQAEKRLRATAERVRTELIQLPNVSQVRIIGARDYQIDVEIPERTLRRYNLTLQRVAEILRRQNVEVPGGTVKSETEEILLRAKNKGLTGEEIARLPVLQTPDGDVLTVADIAVVRDGFVDSPVQCMIDGRPGLILSIERTRAEDLLALCDSVRRYVGQADIEGYSLVYWNDQSVDVADRMNMLVRNGLQGLALVFFVLAIFLDLRLAFWVALGIPIAVLGAGAVMLQQGHTLNMLTMFGFLMALGIVVDDAIVIGENVFKHRQMGKTFVEAAIDGTWEVLPSVGASVMTTVIAFVPLLFVAGVMGKFIAQLPVVVIAMLLISLVEATFILPCHLSHADSLVFKLVRFLTRLYIFIPLRLAGWAIHRLHVVLDGWLQRLIQGPYRGLLHGALAHPALTYSTSVAIAIICFGLYRSGITPWNLFPKLDSRQIEARIVYPDGTPLSVTRRATEALERSIRRIAREMQEGEEPLIQVGYRLVGQMNRPDDPTGQGGAALGAHLGTVRMQLAPVDSRSVTSQELIAAWRRDWETSLASRFPGYDSVLFDAPQMSPAGRPIEFKLLAPATPHGIAQLEQAAGAYKDALRRISAGVTDIDDDSRPGKIEFRFSIRDEARALGVTVADLAETVRAAFYGAEVMRLQRGRHEVKLMVRYPKEERRSVESIDEIRVRTPQGDEYPLRELADITVDRGYSEINRVNQLRSITILADIVEGQANAKDVIQTLKSDYLPQLRHRFPLVRVRWEGQQEETDESVGSLVTGLVVAVLAMFALLTLEFRSYAQPLIILIVIPFGFCGAVFGHALLGLPITLFSLFGMIALTGVVVNDSIVLVDFIDHELMTGKPLREALVEAGTRRFRPVILTSITTIAGLTPMLLERSFQAQVLIPMAASLCFGLMAATILVLVLVPTLFQSYGRIVGLERETQRTPGVDYRLAPAHRPT